MLICGCLVWMSESCVRLEQRMLGLCLLPVFTVHTGWLIFTLSRASRESERQQCGLPRCSLREDGAGGPWAQRGRAAAEGRRSIMVFVPDFRFGCVCRHRSSSCRIWTTGCQSTYSRYNIHSYSTTSTQVLLLYSIIYIQETLDISEGNKYQTFEINPFICLPKLKVTFVAIILFY